MKRTFISSTARSCKPSGTNDLDYPTGKRPSKSFQAQKEEFSLLGVAFHMTDSLQSASVYVAEQNGFSRLLLSLRDSESFLKELKGLQ